MGHFTSSFFKNKCRQFFGGDHVYKFPKVYKNNVSCSFHNYYVINKKTKIVPVIVFYSLCLDTRCYRNNVYINIGSTVHRLNNFEFELGLLRSIKSFTSPTSNYVFGYF
jgi:hypothetical protein